MTREHFFGGQIVHYCQLLAYRRIIRPWIMADKAIVIMPIFGEPAHTDRFGSVKDF